MLIILAFGRRVLAENSALTSFYILIIYERYFDAVWHESINNFKHHLFQILKYEKIAVKSFRKL